LHPFAGAAILLCISFGISSVDEWNRLACCVPQPTCRDSLADGNVDCEIRIEPSALPVPRCQQITKLPLILVTNPCPPGFHNVPGIKSDQRFSTEFGNTDIAVYGIIGPAAAVVPALAEEPLKVIGVQSADLCDEVELRIGCLRWLASQGSSEGEAKILRAYGRNAEQSCQSGDAGKID